MLKAVLLHRKSIFDRSRFEQIGRVEFVSWCVINAGKRRKNSSMASDNQERGKWTNVLFFFLIYDLYTSCSIYIYKSSVCDYRTAVFCDVFVCVLGAQVNPYPVCPDVGIGGSWSRRADWSRITPRLLIFCGAICVYTWWISGRETRPVTPRPGAARCPIMIVCVHEFVLENIQQHTKTFN